MKQPPPSARATVRRIPARGSYEREAVHAILDAGLVAHVGFVQDGAPFVVPMMYARVGDTLYVHGAAASRALGVLASGAETCVTVTLLDGFVFARSAFHHSVNYRSAVVLGRAREVLGDEKRVALDAIVDRLADGRAAACRAPNAKELAATRVLALGLDEASAKVREGGPIDDEEDLAHPCWAGVVPVALVAGAPIVSEPLAPGAPPPPTARVGGRRR
jgi:hypothetical protein